MIERDVKECLIPRLHAAGYNFVTEESEDFGGSKDIRIIFWNTPDFQNAYGHILRFCHDNDGFIIHTSLKNTTVTLRMETEN